MKRIIENYSHITQYSLEITEEKLKLQGITKIIMLQDNDAYNQACCSEVFPYLFEKNYLVEGDGEPNWYVIFNKELSHILPNCYNQEQLLIIFRQEIRDCQLNLLDQSIREHYNQYHKCILEESKDLKEESNKQDNNEFLKEIIDLLTDLVNRIPIQTSSSTDNCQTSTNLSTNTTLDSCSNRPQQIQIFRDTDACNLMGVINSWLAFNSNLEIVSIDLSTSTIGDEVEFIIVIIYKLDRIISPIPPYMTCKKPFYKKEKDY